MREPHTAIPTQAQTHPYRSRTLTRASLVVALCLLGPALRVASARAAGAAPAPFVTISPLSGTHDASPTTQISFLGAPAKDLSKIRVIGSKTGAHTGRLESYSTGDGASLIHTKPLAPGEHVTVGARVTDGAATRAVGSHFDVAVPFVVPTPPGGGRIVPSQPSQVQTYQTAPTIDPPRVDVTVSQPDSPLGDVFISPDTGPGQHGPMILDTEGNLVWFLPMPNGTQAMDFRVQRYEGKPVLTWWQGYINPLGFGQGQCVIYDSSYQPVARVAAGNGLLADLHEFLLTPRGTAWITAFDPIHWDLSAEGGAKDGLLDDGVIQEIDVRTGLVMFEWHALDHVSVADSYSSAPKLSSSLDDYFHVNSIDPMPGGTILISSRNTSALYDISGTTGHVIWRLGGKQSSFTLGPGVNFAYQHDAELLPDGTISVFDNEAAPQVGPESRAIDLSIDPTGKSVSLVHALMHPGTPELALSQGSVQLLPDGNSMVDWGQAGVVSELNPAGQLTFDMALPSNTSSYRAYRSPWTGTPTGKPVVVARQVSATTANVYASWNGATGVASWQVFTGSSPGKLTQVGHAAPGVGFETMIPVTTSGKYFAVQALDASGKVLASSAPVADQ